MGTHFFDKETEADPSAQQRERFVLDRAGQSPGPLLSQAQQMRQAGGAAEGTKEAEGKEPDGADASGRSPCSGLAWRGAGREGAPLRTPGAQCWGGVPPEAPRTSRERAPHQALPLPLAADTTSKASTPRPPQGKAQEALSAQPRASAGSPATGAGGRGSLPVRSFSSVMDLVRASPRVGRTEAGCVKSKLEAPSPWVSPFENSVPFTWHQRSSAELEWRRGRGTAAAARPARLLTVPPALQQHPHEPSTL